MWSLVSREVRSVGRFVSDPRVISGGTSHLMADEAFVVSDVFGALGGGEVDLIYVHCHGILGGLFWSGVGRGVTLPASEFLHP